jgi:hypothetical protein
MSSLAVIAQGADNTAGTITFAITVLIVIGIGSFIAMQARRNR